MTFRAPALLASAAVIALLLSGCTASVTSSTSTPAAPNTADVAALPVAHLSDDAPLRLADGLIPPTNRWFSSLVFSPEPQPVYPYPLAVAPRDAGFQVQLPIVTTSDTTIAAPFTGGLDVTLASTGFTVVAYDPVSVTLRFADAVGPIADVTLAEGSPVVGVRALRETTLALGATPAASGEDLWSTTVAAQTYGILAPGATVADAAVTVPEGAWAQVFAVPADGELAAWADALGDPVTGVTATESTTADAVRTRLEYTGTQATVLVPFAGRDTGTTCTLGTFSTAYGDASACAATELEWEVPRITPTAEFDLAGLDASTRDALVTQLAADLAAPGEVPTDTYFGGKALARTAAMLSLAASLGEQELADTAADTLEEQLAAWIDPQGCAVRAERCFVYDDVLHLVVGEPAAFGSEDGNDHHFHYGYFLTAAAALVTERPELREEVAPVIDLLVADIAGGSADGALPAMRVFDPYRGHSWAAGLAPFSDGNNQESSSEAVAAWNGLALWAAATGDSALEARATWMLSAEADAATQLWLDPQDLPDEYAREMVSLSWSDKRDYATWFSAEPSAILGIQLLPLAPVSLSYLPTAPERVATLVTEAGGEAGFDGALGDQVLLYSALASPDAAARARELLAAGAALDDGSSPSAALAWLAAVSVRDGG